MAKIAHLRCTNCGETYDFDINLKLCKKCGSGLSVELNYSDKFEYLDSQIGLWKFASILPEVKEIFRISLGEGNTVLHRSKRIENELGIKELFLKDETVEPTGSYLDRSSALFMSFALMYGIKRIITYSTGNLGASLSAYSSKSGISLQAYVKQGIDLGKLYQMIAYGANVSVVEAFKELKSKEGAVVVTEYDPLVNEAKKTIMSEVFHQLNFRLPDYVIVPMGEGGLAYATYKALNELKFFLKNIKNPKTRIIGVQPEGCAPIVKAYFRSSSAVEPEITPKTRIFDLNIADPKFGNAALRVIKETEGIAVSVNEEEILDAISFLAEKEGLLAEPAASLTIAALKKLIEHKEIKKESTVVCFITGSGLKDPRILKELALRKSNLGTLIEELSGGKTLSSTKVKILKILSEKDAYGYQIWRELKEKYELNIRIPTVYQHLLDLINDGYVKKSETITTSGRKRIYYKLTDRGKALI
ncbi:MAG: pyridoxal-phosphate dependent enzyme [Thermoproteota archaeon]|nr:pyridoxal-phosphate dependent enzyme [Candidatus Brockarchaeota archaeon]MBO3768457.1 pyridoxal-phosphate dependent enzyme [Candidatus Brockarchaeota archaeon]MBO3801645.1 pyridoxal-phosphate dependent enzyme [Candidatus Brockarchaeota archaeon]